MECAACDNEALPGRTYCGRKWGRLLDRDDAPDLIHRKCGGWLAVTPKWHELRIGVTADTKQTAILAYSAALSEWRDILAKGETGAATAASQE